MSLKEGLKNIIRGYNGSTFSYTEFEEFCRKNGQRAATGERRMRELTHCEAPEINVLMSKKGAIVGWYWKKDYPSQGKFGFIR